MRDESANANQPAHDGQTSITAATASGWSAADRALSGLNAEDVGSQH
jgi:hypothetical protein